VTAEGGAGGVRIMGPQRLQHGPVALGDLVTVGATTARKLNDALAAPGARG